MASWDISTNDMEKISIIVPAYNIEAYIENTVKSICAQNYQNLEIILVDDGSKDRTPEILDNLAESDPRIQVIHKENGGVTSARLCGVAAATGEWIGFVDGDDYIEPEMYAHLYENAKTYDADISHCGYQMVFPSRVDYYYNTGRLAEQDNLTGLKDLLEGSFIEPGLWNKLFHKTLFHSLLHDNLMDSTIRNFEDLLMNFYLFQNAKRSIYQDVCPYHYMLREGSAATSRLNEHKLADPLNVLRIIENAAADQPELHAVVMRRIVSNLIGLATTVSKGQNELVKPHRKSARKELRKMLPQVLRGPFGAKQKLMALWASIWPASYGWVHQEYARIRGTDKKYEVK